MITLDHTDFIYDNHPKILELTSSLVNGLRTNSCGIFPGVEVETEEFTQSLTFKARKNEYLYTKILIKPCILQAAVPVKAAFNT